MLGWHAHTQVVLQKNKDARYRLCKELAGKWEDWMWTVVREKSIYHTLNNFKSDVSGMLRGEGWIVSSALPKARAAITDAHSRFESSMPSLLSKVGQASHTNTHTQLMHTHSRWLRAMRGLLRV